jgi:membrane protease YdiL (CAAX protease family)
MAVRASLSTWLQEELAATARGLVAVPAPPASPLAAALILAAVTCFSAVGFATGGFASVPGWAVAFLVALAFAARRVHQPYPLHVTLVCALAALAYATPGFGAHPFPLLAALSGYVLFLLGSRRLRESLDWARLGRWNPRVTRLVLLLTALPLVTLPLWRLLAAPDVERAVSFVAGVPVYVLPLVALFFALVNALTEEIAFRGVVLDALASAVGVPAALVLQAVAFGLVHVAGVPGGAWGVPLAGIYGLLLGVLRVQTRGLAAPLVAHFLADLVLFGWLVAWAP